MSASSFFPSSFRALAFALAIASTALGCSKTDAELPSPTTPGAYIAAKESATGRYRLYHLVETSPIPAELGGPRLHLVAYDETTKDPDDAKRVVKHGTLTPIHENVIVLARDFFQRDHRVVGFRPLKKDEPAKSATN